MLEALALLRRVFGPILRHRLWAAAKYQAYAVERMASIQSGITARGRQV